MPIGQKLPAAPVWLANQPIRNFIGVEKVISKIN
jgi:hypothetical protein